jgi:hypothetical protein
VKIPECDLGIHITRSSPFGPAGMPLLFISVVYLLVSLQTGVKEDGLGAHAACHLACGLAH